MVMGGAIETLRHLALHRSIPECVHYVVHGGKLALAPSLGTLSKFVPVMLDLRLVPQRHLQEHRRINEVRQVSNAVMASSEA